MEAEADLADCHCSDHETDLVHAAELRLHVWWKSLIVDVWNEQKMELHGQAMGL